MQPRFWIKLRDIKNVKKIVQIPKGICVLNNKIFFNEDISEEEQKNFKKQNKNTMGKQKGGIYERSNSMTIYDKFTPTEKSILTYLAEGYNKDVIAKHLNISVAILNNTLYCLRLKTNTKDTATLIAQSILRGSIAPRVK